MSAKLAQAAPEASEMWKEEPTSAIQRWKARNLLNKESAAADNKNKNGGGSGRSSRFESELRRRSRSRSRERLRNKDLASKAGGSGGGGKAVDTSNPFSMTRSSGSTMTSSTLPPPLMASFNRERPTEKAAPTTGGGFNPFGSVGGTSRGGGGPTGGLLPAPDAAEMSSSMGSLRFGDAGGGLTFRSQNPFDNRGFGTNVGGGVENLPRPFDSFASGGYGGGSGGDFSRGPPSFGGGGSSGGMNPFDNRGGMEGGGGGSGMTSLLGASPMAADARFAAAGAASNPFDRRRSRFDEPPAAPPPQQIQRPGVWNENDQVS